MRQLEEFLAVAQVLNFSRLEAKIAAEIRANLEPKGLSIGPYDVLIAGTALANHATLVTRNTNEFSRIRELKVEDWY